ncbi:hypothetical protein BgiMline_014973 [Biomphalaria glabrata]|nr:hypothetical protein BgiMline_022094 [Biomphalaria glabrata]
MDELDRKNSLCEFNVYGIHEMHPILEGGEANLEIYNKTCNKNPGHIKFVSLEQFAKKHLPFNCRSDELLQLIKVLAGLTVRLAAAASSPDRPKCWPNTQIPYPLMDEKTRTGTGRIKDIHKYSKIQKHQQYGSCPCQKCEKNRKNGKSGREVWIKIEVYTAQHVIFDDLEARGASCRLFFDENDCQLFTIEVLNFADANINEDWCLFNCVTCDPAIMDKLENLMSDYRRLWRPTYEYFKSSRDDHRLVIIVSHPHGCPKQISVGKWLERNQKGDSESKYIYTAATCPGSSGAAVYRLGYSGYLDFDRHVHGGTECNLNYSSIGLDDLD